MRLASRRFSSIAKISDPAALAKHLESKHLINGSFRSSSAGFEVNSPATGRLIAHAARGTAAEVGEAVAAANTAFEVRLCRVFFFLFFAQSGRRRGPRFLRDREAL